MKYFNKKMIITILSIVGILIIVAIGLSLMSRKNIIIYFNDEQITLNAESNRIDLSTFNSEQDIIVKREPGREKIIINGEELENDKELNLGKIEINKEKDIKVEVKYINGKNREFIVNTLPGTFPEYSVEGESEYEGDYYTSTYSKDYDIDHYIFKLDKTREYKIL